jgi:hypothetical protein
MMDYDVLVKRKDALSGILTLLEQADNLTPAALSTEARVKAWFALRVNLHAVLMAEASEALETMNAFADAARDATGTVLH